MCGRRYLCGPHLQSSCSTTTRMLSGTQGQRVKADSPSAQSSKVVARKRCSWMYRYPLPSAVAVCLWLGIERAPIARLRVLHCMRFGQPTARMTSGTAGCPKLRVAWLQLHTVDTAHQPSCPSIHNPVNNRCHCGTKNPSQRPSLGRDAAGKAGCSLSCHGTSGLTGLTGKLHAHVFGAGQQPEFAAVQWAQQVYAVPQPGRKQ